MTQKFNKLSSINLIHEYLLVNDESSKVRGGWDSIHVVEVQKRSRSSRYKLTSTIMLHMITSKPVLSNMNLSGSMTRQVSRIQIEKI